MSAACSYCGKPMSVVESASVGWYAWECRREACMAKRCEDRLTGNENLASGAELDLLAEAHFGLHRHAGLSAGRDPVSGELVTTMESDEELRARCRRALERG